MKGIRTYLVGSAAVFVVGLALLGGVSSTSAEAASFDDTKPCPTLGPFFTCPTGQVGKPYDVQLVGKGGCDLYWFEVVNSTLPAGLTMNTSGRIQGVPAASGRSEVYIHIHDLLPSQGGYPWCGGDNVSQKQFAFNVDAGLGITNQSVKGGTIGQPYTEQLKAQRIVSTNPFTGTDTTATWSLASGNLPTGVNLTATGALEGTPTAEGSFQFTVMAQDGSLTDTETYTISVRQPVVVTHPFGTPPKSEVGVEFSATLTAAGGTGTFTWALAGGTLPSGVVFTPPDAAATTTTTATVAGTPSQAGRYTFSVTATDSEGRVTTVNATVTVAAELAFKTKTLRPAKVGKAYKATVKTTGGSAPVKWKLLRGKLPRGIKFAKLTGTFVGKPKQAGTYRVTLQVTDSLGVKTQQPFTLVVKP